VSLPRHILHRKTAENSKQALTQRGLNSDPMAHRIEMHILKLRNKPGTTSAPAQYAGKLE